MIQKKNQTAVLSLISIHLLVRRDVSSMFF